MRTTKLRPGSILALVVGLVLPRTAAAGAAPETPIQAMSELPEESLLDVGIELFDPGIPTGKSVKELEEQGIFPDVRRAEARYLPGELRETLAGTGQWGAVRVVPRGLGSQELTVSGVIRRSNGMILELDIAARDVTGRRWLARTYRQKADARAYEDQAAIDQPFHQLYARVANDLLKARQRLRRSELQAIRQVASLRFASSLAPDPYSGYLDTRPDGSVRTRRLPADDDPMMGRIARIRERDAMLADTLNEHYADFQQKIGLSYHAWQLNSYDEERALQKIRRQTALRGLLGGAAILGAILMDPDSQAGSSARDAAVIAGTLAIESAINKAGERGMHKAALAELADSLEAEVAPLTVEVEDRTLQLSGSAEKQYAEWRAMLGSLLRVETGLPVDPNAMPGAAAAAGAAPGVTGPPTTAAEAARN